MPKYNYVALDARGQESVGVLEAGTSNEVVAYLRQSGYFPTSVVEEGKGGAKAAKKKAGKAPAKTAAAKAPAAGGKKGFEIKFLKRKTIKTKTLMIFTRQL